MDGIAILLLHTAYHDKNAGYEIQVEHYPKENTVISHYDSHSKHVRTMVLS